MRLSRWLTALAFGFLSLLGTCAHALEPLSTGKGRFTFRDEAGHPEKPVNVWYYRPATLPSSARVVFVMHGVKRNGEDYRNHWVRHAERHKFLLLVPEFSERDYPGDAYQFGNVVDPDHGRWTFSVIEHLFDAVRASESLEAETYTLFGHSAGSQFVHRFMLFMPAPRAELAIAANAGSYTMPVYPSFVLQARFPWSLDKNIVSVEQLKAVFSRRLVVMLGEEDTDAYHHDLPRSPHAMAQGRHRFDRGQNFFQTARKQAKDLQTPFRWELVTVPGVAHSGSKMAAAAVRYLYGDPAGVDAAVKDDVLERE